MTGERRPKAAPGEARRYGEVSGEDGRPYLSHAQMDALVRRGDGHSRKQVAAETGWTESAIRRRTGQARVLLGLPEGTSVAEVARIARERGLIP